MNLRIGISTIPGREQSLASIVASLKDKPLIARDDELTGTSCKCYTELQTSREAAESDWFIMLDDDVVLCRDFEEQAIAALSHAPADVVSLYSSRQALTEQARREKASFFDSPNCVWGAAMAIRGELCADIAKWGRLHVRPSYRSGDTRVALWAAATGHICLASVPSIAQHCPTMTSAIAGSTRKNSEAQAAWFAASYDTRLWNNAVIRSERTAADFLEKFRATGECWLRQGDLPKFFHELNIHFMQLPHIHDAQKLEIAAKVFPRVSDQLKRHVWNMFGTRADGKSLRDVIPKPAEWRTIPID